jgi:F-type H+-transporting ATPase subunit alpha
LWRRSDNIVFSLILGGSDLVNIGDGVECRVRGILQVVDSDEGPSTKKEYEPISVPVGNDLIGKVVDYLGRPMAEDGSEIISQVAIGTDKYLPLLNAQPDMESREQITEALVTGVKALDVLTPLGRGQALQVSGTQGSGKTQLCIDAVIGQGGTQGGATKSGVRCVYAAVGCSSEQLRGTIEQLKAHGCMEYTTVVAATADRPLGEQYAAMLAACSMAEATRDAGGHSLVVLNDVSVMVRMWEKITVAMADLGSVVTEVQAAEVAELSVAALDAIAEAGIDLEAEKKEEEEDSEKEGADNEEMVEYEGMLVSVAAAQRRRFFSSLIQRCAKMHRRLKGGSMSALLVVPGSPATGNSVSRQAKEKILKYKHLTEEQKIKLITALEKQQSDSNTTTSSTNSQKKGGPKGPVPEELRTEVVEEFMSITDGQIVLRAVRDGPTGGVSVNPQLSVSRIGSRAYAPAIASLAPQVRFELAQAEDADKFAADKGSVAAAERAQQRAAAIAAALPQPQRTVCPLEVQVVHLLALKIGLLDGIPAVEVVKRLDALTDAVKTSCPEALKEIEQTQRLTATAEAAISEALATAQSTVSSLTS